MPYSMLLPRITPALSAFMAETCDDEPIIASALYKHSATFV
jgi:hypothetical protein